MTNPFDSSRAASITGPGRDYQPVTPDDALSLPEIAVALYVETAGAVAFESVAGATRTVNVGDFSWVLCGVNKVLATGTTATGIHAITVG